MIDDVVTQHDVETAVAKRKLLACGRDRRRATLPTRKETAITHRQRIDAGRAARAEIKDQTVRAAADFNDARIVFDLCKLLELLAHTPRRALHRRDHFVLMTTQVL